MLVNWGVTLMWVDHMVVRYKSQKNWRTSGGSHCRWLNAVQIGLPGSFLFWTSRRMQKKVASPPPASSRRRLTTPPAGSHVFNTRLVFFSESLFLVSNGERQRHGISLLAWQQVKPFWWKNILRICSVYHACQWWADSVTCTATCGRQRSVKDGVLEASKSASMVRNCCERGWLSGCWRIYR